MYSGRYAHKFELAEWTMESKFKNTTTVQCCSFTANSNVLDILKLDEYAFLDGLDEKFTFSVV